MPPSTAELLAHTTWLRRFAASLVGDGAADDLTQETWIAALRSPPAPERPIRPWLQAVARNLARMRWRSTASRDRREAASDPPEPSLSPEDVVARAETQQRLVQLVLAMAEPYRSTLLLRFFEGLEPSEIARRLDVPAGTVRWRLKEALARLRTQLDAAHAGDRRAWLGALAPLAH
jgi:RNA polymerase sigma-70 factor (ECF subfamily)